jgi:hypothetical protein
MVFGNSTGDDSSTSLTLTSNIFSITNYGDPGSYIQFGTRNNTTSDIRMSINPDGNVGIGTTNASAKLQVGTQTYGSAPDATYFVVGYENFSGPGPIGAISGYPATANRFQVTASLFDVVGGWEAVNGSHALLRASAYDKINTTPAFVVLNNGNVGIGTANPSNKLDVSGSISAQSYLGTSFSLTGTSGSTAIYDTFATTAYGEVYELMAMGTPNSQGSPNYRDILYGKIIVGTGFSGTAVTTYINYVQENPDPRSLYASGISNSLSASIYFKSGSSEVTSKVPGQNTKIRIKIGSYNSGYVGNSTTVRLKRLL